MWEQEYVIHGYANGYTIPCAYALLPNKNADSYTEMWLAIKGLVNLDAPPMLLTDFEEAAASTAKDVFEGAPKIVTKEEGAAIVGVGGKIVMRAGGTQRH